MRPGIVSNHEQQGMRAARFPFVPKNDPESTSPQTVMGNPRRDSEHVTVEDLQREFREFRAQLDRLLNYRPLRHLRRRSHRDATPTGRKCAASGRILTKRPGFTETPWSPVVDY